MLLRYGVKILNRSSIITKQEFYFKSNQLEACDGALCKSLQLGAGHSRGNAHCVNSKKIFCCAASPLLLCKK